MSTRDGTSGLRPPASPRLDDAKVDKAIREHEQAFAALMNLPAASLRVIGDVELRDGQTTVVAHGLGRAPRASWCTEARETAGVAGLIEEVRDGIDRSRYVAFVASGWASTIKVDVVVL